MAVTSENLRLSIVKEASLGVDPVAPEYQVMQVTSESLAPSVTLTQSEMISPGTRGIPDATLTEASAAGDLNSELVYDPATELVFESLLGNEWGSDPLGNGVDLDAIYDYTTVVSLFSEKRWEVTTGGFNYHQFKGLVASSGSLEFAPGAIISNNTSFVGLEMEVVAAEITTSVYNGPDGNSPMAAPRVTSMTLTTVDTETPVAWMSAACFTQLTLSIDNSTRALACIGEVHAKEISYGRINITASGSIYYAADDPLEDLLNETEYGLLISAEDLAGNFYKFFLPRVKFSSAQAVAEGQSQDVMTTFDLQAIESTVTNYTISISRTPRVIPL